jgi:rhomboid-like protein
LAFYPSSATISSFFSQSYKRIRRIYTPSVGASGAIYSILGALITNHGISVAPIIFPFVSLPINTFFPLLMIFEVVELLRGKSVFDHVAHISGGVLGMFRTSWSEALWDKIKKE